MEGKRRRGRPIRKNSWRGLDDGGRIPETQGKGTINIENSGVVGYLNLPGGR